MTRAGVPRSAALVVSSRSLDLAVMSAVLGLEPDRAHRRGESRAGLNPPRPARDSQWAIVESGDGSRPMSVLLDALMARVVSLRAALGRLRAADSEIDIKLDIEQWVSADDEGGIGFGLVAEHVALLAEIGAYLDVDQYRG